jgi:hypothetical protein
MGTNRGVRIAAAAVAVVVGLPLAVGGAALLWAQQTRRDADGFYRTGQQVVATAGRAVTVSDVDIDAGPPLASGAALDRQLTLLLTARSRSDEPLFVGVGPREEVTRYLTGVAHDEVTELDGPGDTVDSDFVPGDAVPADPAAQTFWTAAAEGSGDQKVSWPVREGHWSVVVMKADGSPGLDLSTRAGIKVDFLTSVAIGLLVLGGLILLSCLVVVAFTAYTTPPVARPQPARVP